MTQKDGKHPQGDPNAKDEDSFEPSPEGMSEGTARLAIDKHLKKKLLREHDIRSVENRGHYYVANASSKDGSEFYQLLINKQTGEVQIINRRKAEE
ncbi:MAG: DUF3292 domain-containing protein [Desulfohalobiaceae bacterium]|nr:DUF3292 domain-containing protein [Desulfohalobiaceae bacterium]